jgi:hypothetical protein
MPRHGTRYAEKTSTVRAVRIPTAMADAIDVEAGGSTGFAEWARQAFALALRGGRMAGQGTATAEGFAEGKRQGWAHANKVFREALGVAAEKLK